LNKRVSGEGAEPFPPSPVHIPQTKASVAGSDSVPLPRQERQAGRRERDTIGHDGAAA